MPLGEHRHVGIRDHLGIATRRWAYVVGQLQADFVVISNELDPADSIEAGAIVPRLLALFESPLCERGEWTSTDRV